ncbi:MAG TPA: pyridoxamine 5'-phosphate oxidase family protein [Candidatus Binatia bacterium]|nr:pyridoxamine 5'-phosphate oxidase family protein [Candidatus Binatia bacterium]
MPATSDRGQAEKRAEPRASRPHIPGYGIAGETEGRGLLPWTWAEQRLGKSWNYWLATTRPDGRPHVMPVWGLWRGGAFWFSTGEKTVKARNLAANPRCVVCTERADDAVVLEGVVEWVEACAELGPLWQAYQQKYKWNMKGTGFFRVRPAVAFGLIEKGELFTQTATRWIFS